MVPAPPWIRRMAMPELNRRVARRGGVLRYTWARAPRDLLPDPPGGARLPVGPAGAGPGPRPVPPGGAHPALARAPLAAGAGGLRRRPRVGPGGPGRGGQARLRARR